MYNVVEILSKAADILQSGGVIAGRRYTSYGAHCALGAIDAALGRDRHFGGSPVTQDIAKELMEVLSLSPAVDRYNCFDDRPRWEPMGVVAAWSNNLVDAGKGAEVIAGFRRAALLLQQSEVAH